jgi:two-component system, LytTR family, sensor kinase
MINPITGKRVYFTAYTLVWIIFAVIQTSVEFFVFNTTLGFAITDSIVFNLLFFLLGIAIWFPVKYMSFSEKKLLSGFLNHLVLGVIMLLTWDFSGYLIIKYLTGANEQAISFLSLSMPYRSVFGALIFILMIMLYYLMVYSENLKQKINNEANLRTLVREAELSALKAQINPHFLFNSLNSISSLTMRDPSSARKMIIELSDFLRYSLKHKEREETSLEEELQNIKRYLEIEKIRFESRLKFEMKIPEECKKLRVPNMILQPLFENAIKHGVYESLEPVSIQMDAICKMGYLIITILNDYDPSLAPRKGAGIGLKNINSRLKLIYGREDLLSATGENNIFIVRLRIPADLNEIN